jgi:phenol hydroxylase P0 protein
VVEVNANNRWVKLLRQTENGFIEFEFFVSSTELYVELILPLRAFEEFCAMNQVRFIAHEGAEPMSPAAAAGLLKRVT